MALGFSWLFTAFGRIVSMMSDRETGLYNWLWLVFDLVLSGLALAFALGFVALIPTRVRAASASGATKVPERPVRQRVADLESLC